MTAPDPRRLPLLLAAACASPDQDLRLAAFYGAIQGGIMGEVYQQEDHTPEAGETVSTQVVDNCPRDACPNGWKPWQGTLAVRLGFQGDASGLCAACDLNACTSSAWSAEITGEITVSEGLNINEDCGPVDGDPFQRRFDCRHVRKVDRVEGEAVAACGLQPVDAGLLQRHRVVFVEVVDADDDIPARQQALRKAVADEPGRAGNQNSHGNSLSAPSGSVFLLFRG